MNRTVTKFSPAFCSTLLRSASVGLVVLTMLFAASSAKAAGCAPPYKTGLAASIPFVSPHGDDCQEGEESNGPASIVGLWHLNYTANSAITFR